MPHEIKVTVENAGDRLTVTTPLALVIGLDANPMLPVVRTLCFGDTPSLAHLIAAVMLNRPDANKIIREAVKQADHNIKVRDNNFDFSGFGPS
jgi:hypothetical protein